MFPYPISRHETSSLLVCDAANFDGTSDYVTRGAALTGVSDSKAFTLVFWRKKIAPASGPYTILCSSESVAGPEGRFRIEDNAGILVVAKNSSGTTIQDYNTSTSPVVGTWECWMISCNISISTVRRIYVGDTNCTATVNTNTNDTIDFTASDWSVGATPDGLQRIKSDLAEFMFWPGVFADFSNESTRRLFYSSTGKPVDPTATRGAFATLGVPAIYFHLNAGQTPIGDFVLNDDGGATGGAFTVTGTLTASSTSPSD